jgi:hypothetical protein
MSVAAPGWYSAFLVACSCERKQGNRNLVAAGTKLTLTAFAKASHRDKEIIAAYLDAWESAAGDELVPTADELTPEDALAGLEFGEVHTAESWAVYFDALMEGKRAKDRAYDAQRRYPEPTEDQVAEAIRTNPQIEKRARREVIDKEIQRDRERAITDPAPKPKADDGSLSRREEDETDAQFDSLVIKLRAMKRHGQEALGLALDIQGFQQKTKRAIVIDAVDELRVLLNAIQEAAEGRSMDDELAALLGG